VKVDLQQLRFAGDDPALYGIALREGVSEDRVRSRGLAQNIRVSDRVLPRVLNAAAEAAARLGSTKPTTLFVYAGADINALCYSDPRRDSILVFVSSALVTTLDPAEWQCVIGHELGHHLLAHHRYPEVTSPVVSLRVLELKRAAEISADRAGLIACGDVEVALRAMLKVASGLDARHLDIDVSDYMRQVAELRDSIADESILFSTHPPFPVRVRAVVRFDSVLRELQSGTQVAKLLRNVDASIQRDLDAAACGLTGNRFTEQARVAAFWVISEIVCADGAFSAGDQTVMVEKFGQERVDALKRLLATSGSKPAALSVLREKAGASRMELEAGPLLATRHFEEIMAGFTQHRD
jgi:hypothetical protein